MFGLTLVQDAFGAITCRNNTTGARACSSKSTCPTGWSKISNFCSTQTVGGSITYIGHHDIGIKCTWEQFQADWAADPGDPLENPVVPISVSQLVEGAGNYATCGGWNTNDVPTEIPTNFSTATFGSGKFYFNVNYQSAAPLTCTEDPNAGIGNNCTKADEQNPKHAGTSTPGASRACVDNSPAGTTLTYQFACATGVTNTGRLTLAPVIFAGPDGEADTTALAGSDDVQVVAFGTTGLSPTAVVIDPGPDGVLQTMESADDLLQPDPLGSLGSFTNCSPDRIRAGACTMQLGGIPMKTVKVKGQNVTVVDDAACSAAFPAAEVPNALNTSQSQVLDAKEILFYQEVASEGVCGANNLPTVPGLPAAAYGRYCQSDIDLFSDNLAGNMFAGDPADPVEGFDNELRVCPVVVDGGIKVQHTAAHDVEQVTLALADGLRIEPQGPLNLNCTSGGNTDSAGYKVKIPDQAPLLSVDIDTSPGDAPKLEGVSPTSTAIITDLDGVRKLELTYPTCRSPEGGLAGAVKTNNPGIVNNQNVTLHLTGQTNGAGLGPVLFNGEFIIKVNGI